MLSEKEREQLEALADLRETEGDAACELLRRIARVNIVPIDIRATSTELNANEDETLAYLVPPGSRVVTVEHYYNEFFHRIDMRFFVPSARDPLQPTQDPSPRLTVLGS